MHMTGSWKLQEEDGRREKQLETTKLSRVFMVEKHVLTVS